jgi:hypothetical protein
MVTALAVARGGSAGSHELLRTNLIPARQAINAEQVE